MSLYVIIFLGPLGYENSIFALSLSSGHASNHSSSSCKPVIRRWWPFNGLNGLKGFKNPDNFGLAGATGEDAALLLVLWCCCFLLCRLFFFINLTLVAPLMPPLVVLDFLVAFAVNFAATFLPPPDSTVFRPPLLNRADALRVVRRLLLFECLLPAGLAGWERFKAALASANWLLKEEL
jgi:hypothetical protein